MSTLVDCCSPCTPVTPPVNIPGTGGQNAFGIVGAAFVVPAALGTVTVTVDSSAWFVVGQPVIVGPGLGGLGGPSSGTFVVTAVPTSTTVTLQWLGYVTDGVVAGNTLGLGSIVSPSAFQPQTLQRGTTTLVAGTKTVTGVVLTANSSIMATTKTPTNQGDLSVPSASRNVGAGSFVINSSSGTDTSTVDWVIVG